MPDELTLQFENLVSDHDRANNSIMKISPLLLPALVATWATFMFMDFSFAATPGSDTADSTEYEGGKWESGKNGGKGFMGWNLVVSGVDGGVQIGDSSLACAGINTDTGKAFGLYARGKGKKVDAYRSFDSALEVGQSFSFELSVNFRNGSKGFDLRRSGDEERIFNLNIGGDDYVVNAATTGNGSIGSAYDSKTILTLIFTQKTPLGGTWKITRRGGVSSVSEGTYDGVPSGVKFYVIDTDVGPENELWINRLTISSSGQAKAP